MVYLTGDIHGNVRDALWLIQKHQLTPSDILVLLGDVGLNYYGNEQGDKKRKQLLDSAGIPILCIHGNHEERPFNIQSYGKITWHGGTVYVEEKFPNLLFAKDGEVYDLEGHSAIVVGGAYSVDKFYRLRNGMNWFPDEQPSAEIKLQVEQQLSKHNWKMEIVLSHTCPQKYVPTEAFMPGLDQSLVDHSTEEWLDYLEDKLDYAAWFCGHWHIDKRIDKMHFLMHGIEALPEPN